jgi:hypothetical protein
LTVAGGLEIHPELHVASIRSAMEAIEAQVASLPHGRARRASPPVR